MFALHIDTARTWRGGQNQVLLTVLGLRALGHRAVLVAHGEGELYRRASEGPDLVPLAPRNEVDLSAAWKLSRIIRQWKPQIVHAHDPHAVAMAGLALSFSAPDPRPRVVASRRVDFHLQRHSFSKWKYRQVDLFLAASDAIRDILVHDGIDADRRSSSFTTGSMSGRSTGCRRSTSTPSIWLPHGAPGARERRRAGRAQGTEVSGRGDAARAAARCRTRTWSSSAKASCARRSRRQVKELHLEKHVLLPGFREDVLQLMKSADLFVMSSVTEGLGSTVLDAMAMRLAVVGTRAGGIPEAVVHGETGLLVAPGEPRELAAAIVRLLKDPALGQRMGAAGHARVADQFGVGRLLRRHAAGLSPRRADEANRGALTSPDQPSGRP